MKCLTCKHCEIDFGTYYYSDLTPGDPGEWKCKKGRWDIDDETGGSGKDLVQRAFLIGESCSLWESDGRQPNPERLPGGTTNADSNQPLLSAAPVDRVVGRCLPFPEYLKGG